MALTLSEARVRLGGIVLDYASKERFLVSVMPVSCKDCTQSCICFSILLCVLSTLFCCEGHRKSLNYK